MPFRFLDGFRLLDLSQFAPGPYASLMLADLGCDVMRIEPPGGEPMRQLGPMDADGISAWYKQINAGKRVVEIDLKSGAGKAALAALVGKADALLESYRPGVLERLGFSFERLHALNPRLTVCSLSGWGQSGPYRAKAAHDINYMALMGGLAMSGTPSRPAIAYPQTADYASGIHAALCIVAGLLAAARTGRGSVIDTSIAESVLPWQGWSLTALARAPAEAGRGAMMLNGGAAFYNIYRTKDGQFATLGAVEKKFWQNFCAAVSRPQWAARHDEPLPQTALIEEVAALLGKETLAHWDALLSPLDCCFEPVWPLEALAEHPQIAARGLVRRHARSEPAWEVLFPALIDGAAQPERVPLSAITPAAALAAWGAA